MPHDPCEAESSHHMSTIDLGSENFEQTVTDHEIVFVDFWASWCGPCRAEQAELEALWDGYGPKGARFLGVNIRDEPTNARSHVEEFGVSYPSVYNKDSTIAYKYRVLFIPTTFVLDRSGRIAAKIIGPTNEEDLRRILDGVLAT